MAIAFQVTFDCADPDKIASFWAEALGYQKASPPEGYASWPDFLTALGVPKDQWNNASAIIDPDGRGSRIYFQRVPESKIVKNRVHLDLNMSGSANLSEEDHRAKVDAAVQRLTQLGATQVRPYQENGEYWVVMQDPEGNEFCVQ